MRILILATFALALSACTTVPEPIQGDYPDLAPKFIDENLVGNRVRWGGVILGTHNRGDRTCFEILSRELDRYLRPQREDYSNGRYIACKAGFQDPLVFGKGREVTTTGTIRDLQVRKVDNFDFRYPLLEVDTLVLWEKRRHVTVYRGYGDPWHYRYPWYWGYHPIGGSWGQSERVETLPDASIVTEGSGNEPEVTPDE